MRPRLVIFGNPGIEVGLQLVDCRVEFFSESDSVELVEHGFVEALADAICLRAPGLGARVLDVFDREVEFVLVPLRFAAIFAAAIGSTRELDVMALEE